MTTQEARSQAMIYPVSGVESFSGSARIHPGILRLSGNDAADFLNRMSTNDISKLRSDEFVTTILTTEKGRMIDVVRVLRLVDGLLLLTGEGSQGAVRHWLEKYVIMEDIRFANETASYLALNLFGGAISRILAMTGIGQTFPGDGNAVLAVKQDGGTLYALRDELWPATVVTLLAAGNASWIEALHSAIMGIAPDIPGDALNALMIEEGVPVAGKEISGEFNPLECNFWRFVNFSKGCYIGQEVIARLDSYHKLQKRMTGFHFDPDVVPGAGPGTIFAGDEEVGRTTRHARSTRGDRWVALGFLKIGSEQAALSYAGATPGGRIAIHATTLPFAKP